MNWNKYKVQVLPRLIDAHKARNVSLESLTSKFELTCEMDDTVAEVKALVEKHMRSVEGEMQFDVLGLRLGERISLPNNARMSELLSNYNTVVSAMIRLHDANDIETQEYTMDGAASRHQLLLSASGHWPPTKIISNTASAVSSMPSSASCGDRLLHELMNDKSHQIVTNNQEPIRTITSV